MAKHRRQNRQLVLRLGDDPARPQWVLVDGQGRVLDGPAAQTGADELAARVGETRVSALVPSADVLLTRANVPTRSERRLRQAVPYAVEDRLADDVETLHFALGEQDADGGVDVAVVAHERMRHWLSSLEAAGLAPDYLVPDVLALPAPDNGPVVLVEDSEALVRTAATSGLAIETDNLPAVLAALVDGERDSALTVLNAGTGDTGELVERAHELGLGVEQRALRAGELLPLLAGGLQPAPVVNLRQADYARAAEARNGGRAWRAAAVLGGALVAAQLVYQGLAYQRLASANEALQTEKQALFREAFPERTRSPRPKVELERALAGLRGEVDSGGDGLLPLLSAVAPAVSRTDGVALRGLEYRDGILRLSLRAPAINVLERLRQGLASSDVPVRVELESVTATNDGTNGRLRITAGSRG